jgi:hypothetical protein
LVQRWTDLVPAETRPRSFTPCIVVPSMDFIRAPR